ncbi:MAG: PQQ-binding-like beta-propeller repeat protein, partial [Candidatus Thermoplasmatota archaeon]|nr:PQQ-binding-like beta-propeller repeat protein [Candidatus Thermoplasmatota archaeon]
MMRKILTVAILVALLLGFRGPEFSDAQENDSGTMTFERTRGEDRPIPTDTLFPWPMHLHNELHTSFTSSPAPEAGDMLWNNATGNDAYGSPTVADGMVFIGAGTATMDYMFAFYQNNGTLAWQTQTDSPVSGGTGVTSSPAYASGYLVFGADRIYCLYANNGTVKWKVENPPFNQNWGDGTPTIADGKVFIGGSDRKVYNIDLETGSVLWTFQTQATGSSNYGLYAAPAVYNGYVYVAACDGWVYRILINQPGPTVSAANSFNTGRPMYGSPVIFDDKVYIGNGYTSPSTLNSFYALSATDLSLVWEFLSASSTSFMSSAAIAYNMLFVGSVDGNLYVLDPQGSGGIGSVIWQYNIGSTWSSPAIADGQVFIGSRSNHLYAFNVTQPGPVSYKWRYNTFGNVDSSPAVADGLVFVGTFGGGGRLYCFGQLGDLIPPQATSFSPTGTGVDINTNFVVEWNEAMDWISVENSFSFTDGFGTWDAADGTFFHFPPTNTSTFDPSFSLDWGTTYWITFSGLATDVAGNPLDGNGDGTGGDDLTWSFTTVPDNPPVLALWEPGGSAGQVFDVGEVIIIVWSASDDKPWPNGDNVVNLSYGPTPAGGTTIVQYEAEDSNFNWDTSAVAPGTYYVEINVFDSIGQVSTTSSANSFDIVASDSPPTVSAWEPGGTSGQSYIVGTGVQVEWTATDDNAMPADNINVTYGSAMTWNDIVRDTANDGVHTWDTTGVPPGNYYVNVSAYDSAGQTSSDLGNFTFGITLIPNLPPSISVLQPSGGESWSGGSSVDVVWDMTDDLTPETNLVIYLNYSYSSGGGPIAGPLSGHTSPGTYPWTLPLIDAVDVVVEIDIVDEGGAVGSDTSALFEVDSTAPTITWTNPRNGESGVPRSTNVEAQWSEGMNQSATEPSFQLLDNSTWLPVSGTVTWIGDSLIFDPDSDLAGDSWYTANFTTQARDDSEPGNALTFDYSWSFRTAPVPDLLMPEIADVQATPSPQEVYFGVNVSAIVTDDFSVGVVNLNVSGPSGVSNDSMLFDGGPGRYYIENLYDEIGTHAFTIWATDSSGNVNSSSGQFEIVDTTMPTLEDVTIVPPSPEVFDSVNISVLVQDNYQLDGVWVEIIDPDALLFGNFSMPYDSGTGRYYYQNSYSKLGGYTCTIWASDTSGNWNGTSDGFLVEDRTAPLISHTPITTWSAFAPLPIQATVTDTFLDDVRLNHTDVSSTTLNVTMTPLGGDDFGYSVPAQGSAGIVSYFIWANDTSGNEDATLVVNVNMVLDDNPPGISDVDAVPNPQEIYGYVNISARVVDDYGVQAVSVAITWPDSSSTNDSMSPAAGDFFHLNES